MVNISKWCEELECAVCCGSQEAVGVDRDEYAGDRQFAFSFLLVFVFKARSPM